MADVLTQEQINKILQSNLSEEQISKLSKEEKEVVAQTLKDMANGDYSLYNEIKYADYKEVPVDILTFLDDNKYLGKAWHDEQGNSKLFPFWRKELVKVFPDNITTNYNNAILTGSRGLGKMLPDSSLVLTEEGYIKNGDLKPGMKVYSRDGELCNILDTFHHKDKEIYEVFFSDGTSTRCGLEHLWQVTDIYKQSKPCEATKVMTTEQLLPYMETKGGKRRFKIPLCEPINFPHKDTLISPYMMGCLLGDGCFTEFLRFTSMDDQIISYIENEVAVKDYIIKKNKHGNRASECYIVNKERHGDNKNIYKEELISLGLWGHTADSKFIPKEYLYNDPEARLELLRGLMDTDGEVIKGVCRNGKDHSYNAGFSTTSEQLKDDVVWLVQSLGGVAKVHLKANKKYHYKTDKVDEWRPCKDHYRIYIKLPNEVCPFSIDRKRSLYESVNHVAPTRYIRDIKKLDYKEDCTCIYVDNPEHLYITNDFIVTHNTEIAIAMCCYMMYRVMCLNNPREYYGLKPTETIAFAFMNITKELVENIGMSKFQNTVQMSPWFMQHGKVTGRETLVWNPPEYINIIIGSQSHNVIGQAILFCFFDEISFLRNKDIDKQKTLALDMINTAIGGMKTRFIKNGKNASLLVLASSKRSDSSFLESYLRKKIESEGENLFVVDKAVWEVQPKGTYSEEKFPVAVGNKFLLSQIVKDPNNLEEYIKKGYKIIYPPIDFLPDFMDDIDRALCDFAGIASTELSKYISGEVWADTVDDTLHNPFMQEVLEIGNGKDDARKYQEFFDMSKVDRRMMSHPLYVHMDMSVSGDKTGIAGVWIRSKATSQAGREASNELTFQLAFAVSIKAPKGRQVSFDKNRRFIYWLKDMGFNVKGVSTDSFESADTGQALQAHGYNYKQISVDRTERVGTNSICKPYQYFRSCIYENRLVTFYDELLSEEVIDLERNINTGRVDHPEGGCITGDTQISLCDGRELSILELIDEFNQGKQNYVYSVDMETLNIEPDLIVNAFKTKTDAELVEVILDNGESIKCTPDHRFMLRDGSYCEAQYLMAGSSLMPLYRKYPTKGLIGYRMFYNTKDNKWHYEHRKFCKQVDDEKYLVHHINCNPKDNSPTNLIWVSRKKHHQIHDELQIGTQSVEAREKRKRSVKAYADAHPESYIERGKKASITLLSKPENAERHKREQERIDEIEKIFNIKWDELSVSEKNSYGGKYTRLKHPEIQEQISVQLSKNHAEGKFDNAKKALAECNKQSHERALQRYYESEEYQTILAINEMFGIDYDSLPANQKISYRHRYTNTMKRMIKNHKVVGVRFIDETQDVYDITTEHNHNFALTAGVFIHNSKDISDAVCLRGDTKIYLFDEQEKSISELYEEYIKDKDEFKEFVMSYNTESNSIIPLPIKEVVDNGYREDLIELTFNDKTTYRYKLICTPDHLLLTKNGEYIKAKDSLNVELMPFDYSLYPSSSSNNKVTKIERADSGEVYDIKLSDIHNFALSCGVFVHNCGAIYNASQNAEQFAYDFGEEDIEDVVNVNNSTSGENQKKQIAEDFEQQLQELFNPNSIKQLQEQRQKEQEDEDSDNYPSSPIAIDGMLIW